MLVGVVARQARSHVFERMLRQTIDATYPENERDSFTAHFRGLMDLWIGDEQTRLAVSQTSA